MSQDTEEEAVLVHGVGVFSGGCAQTRPVAEPDEPNACTWQRNLTREVKQLTQGHKAKKGHDWNPAS